MISAVSAPIRPVILSGGSGTRLWPMSRSDLPKQLLPLLPPDSMLQATARRATGQGFHAPYVVANARHAAAISSQLGQCGCPADALILEPMGRNTAPAIALAAALAAETDPATLLLVMPSDQVITDVEAFHQAIGNALSVAAEGWLVTFGISPTAPETGYGYIETGEQLAPGVQRAVRFVEKPDRVTAEGYLTSGNFVWNGGIFLFRADAILTALGHRAPGIRDAAISSIAGARHEGPIVKPDPVAFAANPSESIDYAVMEHWDRVAVVPVEMGWSDIGSWDALHDFSPATDDGNQLTGDVVAIDTTNCLIRSSGPLVAAVGIQDLILVATEDAIMVAPRGRSQEVRHLIATLKERGHPTLDHSLSTSTEWGSIRLLTEAETLKIQEITVNPGAALPGLAEGSIAYTVLAGTAAINGEQYQQGDRIGASLAGGNPILNAGDQPLRLLAEVDSSKS